MGDIAVANGFLALSALSIVGASWAAWKDRADLVFGWIAVGVAWTLFSAAKHTWEL